MAYLPDIIDRARDEKLHKTSQGKEVLKALGSLIDEDAMKVQALFYDLQACLRKLADQPLSLAVHNDISDLYDRLVDAVGDQR